MPAPNFLQSLAQRRRPSRSSTGAQSETHSSIASTERGTPVELQSVDAASESIVPADSSSQISIASTSRRAVPVFIELPGGHQIVVPVIPSTSIAQLHEDAIRHAEGIAVEPLTPHNSALCTTGRVTAFVRGEGSVVDILSVTESNTLSLKILGSGALQPHTGHQQGEHAPSAQAPRASVFSSESHTAAEIRTRWITPELAADYHYLDQIPTTSDGITTLTPLSELKKAAERSLSKSGIQSQGQNLRIELFTQHCHLTCADSALAVGDLGIQRDQILNIFICLVKDGDGGLPVSDTASEKTLVEPRIRTSWTFNTTTRGTAAFLTCLKALLLSMKSQRTDLDAFLAVLWEITHFPPAVLAFRDLYEHQQYDVSTSDSLAIFAYTIYVLSLRTVPTWMKSTPDCVFEASRQIFSWLHSLQPAYEKLESQIYPVRTVSVELTELGPEVDSDPSSMSAVTFVDLPSESANSKSLSRVRVGSTQALDSAKAKMMAAALVGKYSNTENFYLELPEPSPIHLLQHRRLHRLDRSDFGNLLEVANQDSTFKLLHPLQLGNIPSASLPVVTLSGNGWVSLYDQYDYACGERYFYLWNMVEGKKKQPPDAGQTLLQKLEPVVQERKKNFTWDLDAWTEAVDPVTPCNEAIVVCVDRSGSMSSAMPPTWTKGLGSGTGQGDTLSRLSEVKEFFTSLVARLSAAKVPVHLGLISFSHRLWVRVEQDISPVLLNFQDKLHQVYPANQTAIWDALRRAQEMLTAYKPSSKGAKAAAPKLRVILLTDGQDNVSSLLPFGVCRDFMRLNIVLDAIVIGTDATADLFRFAKHTGGYAFAPQRRDSFFQIPLLETFADIAARPDIVRQPLDSWERSSPKSPDMSSNYNIPARRLPPHMSDDFVPLAWVGNLKSGRTSRTPSISSVLTKTSSLLTPSSSASTRSSASRASTVAASAASGPRLIHVEIREMINNLHEYLDVYLSQSNMGFWKVVLSGPSGSPYAAGNFMLYIDMGEGFPVRPPEARFITPMLHPNITKQGRICHPIFDREWHSGIHIYQVLEQIYGLLMSIETRDTVDPLLTQMFWSNPESSRQQVIEFVKHTAMRSRKAWKAEILGG